MPKIKSVYNSAYILFKILHSRFKHFYIISAGYVFIKSLSDSLTVSHLAEHPADFDPRAYLKPGRQAIKDMVAHKMIDVLGCSGKA